MPKEIEGDELANRVHLNNSH